MLSTEQATTLLAHYTEVSRRYWVSWLQQDPATPKAKTDLDEATDALIAMLTGSSRVDRKAIDPNTETQLVEAVTVEPKLDPAPKDSKQFALYATAADVKAIERSRLHRAGFENLFDELVVRQRRMHEVLADYIGCDPAQFKLRGRDLLFMTVDLGKFMLALGGPWRDIVEAIETDETEKHSRTKFATRSQEDEPKPMIVAKIAAVESGDATPEAAKG